MLSLYDGQTMSNTLYLERTLGWYGLLIEASPPFFIDHAALPSEARLMKYKRPTQPPNDNQLDGQFKNKCHTKY